MNNILIDETIVNSDKHYTIYKSDVYETRFDNLGNLYKFLVKEYGRCISRVYQDTSDGKIIAIGWVFVKRQKYDGCKDTYLQETWITLHKSMPMTTTRFDYLTLKG